MFRRAKESSFLSDNSFVYAMWKGKKNDSPIFSRSSANHPQGKSGGTKVGACWTFCLAWSLIGCLCNYLHGVYLSANARKWQRVLRQGRRWETPWWRWWINPLNHSLQGKWIKPLKWEFNIGNIHNVHLILRISTTSETMSYSVLCR